ncbi:hypothetical protein EGW08_010953 [Elysia chlorotica]|uniref:Glycosyltransferase family 92 protein n=1 Tax=Elysia chlorotica TaxID=188477 RepID=A0A433TIA3_ELYCH|nr:hypothetical protein EGW08_010953 [Elysia chlorotica]
MRALRSVHKKLLTVFLFAYITVLLISFTNLNTRKSDSSSRTTLIRSSPGPDEKDEELYFPLYPSNSEDIAKGTTFFRLSSLRDSSRQRVSSGSLLFHTLGQTKIKTPLFQFNKEHREQYQPEGEKQQQFQQPQEKSNQEQGTSERKGQELFAQPHIDIRIRQKLTSQRPYYSYDDVEVFPSRQRHSFHDTVQANELLFEMEKDFPGLRNFQPDPLIEPLRVQDQGNTNSNGSFTPLGREVYVYSAYLDDRKRNDSGVFVRVIALLSQKAATDSMYSHSEIDGVQSPEQCVAYEMCENHSKFYGPSNSGQQQPVERGLSNRLSFAVCVSPLFGDISPSKVIEFIELSRILGAEHFYMYNFSIPASVSLVLEHYRNLGLITVLPFDFPSGVRNSAVWYHGQLLANNDCLYRSMPRHDLVAFNDLDEFIVPRAHSARTWREAFSELLTHNTSGFSFQSAFFDSGVRFRLTGGEHGGSRSSPFQEDDLITMRKTSKTKLLSKVRTKVMLCPWRVFEVGIHHISKQNREEWLSQRVDPSLALIHHYRPCIANLGMRCDSWRSDTTIPDRYGDQLVPRVRHVLRQLGTNKQ